MILDDDEVPIEHVKCTKKTQGVKKAIKACSVREQ